MQDALQDKVCIVTGAGSGIGRACVEKLVGCDSKVVLVDLKEQALNDVMATLRARYDRTRSGNTLALALSISSAEDMQRMAEETIAAFGRIDCLVACAGILRLGSNLKTVADTTLDEWNTIIGTNLTGTFLSNRAVLPAMSAQRQGDIVNISSISGRQGRPFDGPYCASKFGIIGLSESLAEEVAGQGIRVQTLLPDAVETPLWEQNGPAALKPVSSLPPERVAEFILYMLALPRDTYLPSPIIAPMKQSRKKRKGG